MSVTVKSPGTDGPPTPAARSPRPSPSAGGTTAVPPVPFEHEELVVRRGRAAAATWWSPSTRPRSGRRWAECACGTTATADGVRDALRLAGG